MDVPLCKVEMKYKKYWRFIYTYHPWLVQLPQLQLASVFGDPDVTEDLREPDNGGKVDLWFWGRVQLY